MITKIIITHVFSSFYLLYNYQKLEKPFDVFISTNQCYKIYAGSFSIIFSILYLLNL